MISPLSPLLQVPPVQCHFTGVFRHLKVYYAHPSSWGATQTSLSPSEFIWSTSSQFSCCYPLVFLPAFLSCVPVHQKPPSMCCSKKYSLCKSLKNSHFPEIPSSNISISQCNVTAFMLTIFTGPMFILQRLLQSYVYKGAGKIWRNRGHPLPFLMETWVAFFLLALAITQEKRPLRSETNYKYPCHLAL